MNKEKLFLEEAIRQYDLVMRIGTIITSKAQGIITITSSLIVLLTLVSIQLYEYGLLDNVHMMILLIFIYISFIASLLLAMLSYNPQDYVRVNSTVLFEEYYTEEVDDISKQLLVNINSDAEENDEVNFKRAKWVRFSFYPLIIGVVLLFIMIFKIIII
jgi:hypothetical protein